MSHVQTAIHIQIHRLVVNGATYIANISEQQIPTWLAPVVVGVSQLNDFFPTPLTTKQRSAVYSAASHRWGPLRKWKLIYRLVNGQWVHNSQNSWQRLLPREAVALDGSGNVFLADCIDSQSNVKDILAAGGYETVRVITTNVAEPTGISIARNGDILVTDTLNNWDAGCPCSAR